MKYDLSIKNDIIIPEHELEITTSRSGGAGGQHVNKTDTRITVRWNVKNTTALDETLKQRLLHNLQSQLTGDGDLIVHNSESRSQSQNKDLALKNLAKKIRQALYVPKKRMKTRVPKGIKEARLKAKTQRSELKKSRSKKFGE
ncbi:hypothetical protein A3F06_00960 [candidate division TM6 bacterium RIFCSPHIGHO2_12_FULL_36_22]|nr:MAG: hypothetical protein A3F06_00960 [candidate division TM6 bacterium RIFCSPHIGHO2_12_FULL_36_22]